MSADANRTPLATPAPQMSRCVEWPRGRRLPLLRFTLRAAIILMVALPLLTVATQFLAQFQRFDTWSPPQLVVLFGGLLATKMAMLLSLQRMLRRHAE